MAVDDKTDVVLNEYVRLPLPTIPANIERYIQEEYRRIEDALRSVSEASIKVSDQPPENPRRGTVRYAVSPWDPLSNGTEGLVVYNGNAWVGV